MMSLQYISDSDGKTTGVFIPISEWNEMKEQFPELDKMEVPQWQKDEVRKRIKEAEQNPDKILHWDEVKDRFVNPS